jgi:hypothetical protein
LSFKAEYKSTSWEQITFNDLPNGATTTTNEFKTRARQRHADMKMKYREHSLGVNLPEMISRDG